MKRWIVWIAGAVIVGLGLTAAGWIVFCQGTFPWFQQSGRLEPSAGAAGERLTALGRLEPAGEVIDIGAMVGDRLISIAVKEGDSVKEGQPLAQLDSHALRKLEVEALENELKEVLARRDAELALAEARIAAARLSVEQAGTHEADIQAEELKIPVLQRNWELATKTSRRLGGLSEELSSDQEREQSELAVEKAKAEWEAAKKLLEKGKQSHRLALDAAQAELSAALASKQVALSSVPDKSLNKKLELARAQRDRSVLHAPCDGTVLKVFVRPGELLGPAPILQMADLDRMVVIAQVYETDLKRIFPEQKATITSRSLPSPYDDNGLEGRVIRIGRVIAQPSLKELNPLAPADRRAAEVRIELTKQSAEQAKNFIHMQVDVEFTAAQP